jgi:hypothetical protein
MPDAAGFSRVDLADRARSHVLDAHRGAVEAVLTAGAAAAADVPAPAERRVVETCLELALRGDDLPARLVGVLRDTVDALGFDLAAEPVAAPPYVVITARGPMLRATLDAGRLVVLVRTFERTATGYVPAGTDPDGAVEVRVHRT